MVSRLVRLRFFAWSAFGIFRPLPFLFVFIFVVGFLVAGLVLFGGKVIGDLFVVAARTPSSVS